MKAGRHNGQCQPQLGARYPRTDRPPVQSKGRGLTAGEQWPLAGKTPGTAILAPTSLCAGPFSKQMERSS